MPTHRRQLAMPEDMLGCHTEMGLLLASSGEKPGVLSILQHPEESQTMSDSANVSRAKVKKPSPRDFLPQTYFSKDS